MSLLTICQNVARDIGLVVPSSIIGNDDETAARLLAQCRRELYELRNRYDWTILQVEHTFALVDGTASYALPSDFDRQINETDWNRTDTWRLIGPTSPQQWQSVKSGAISSAPRFRWRIKRTSTTAEFYVDPTPGSDEDGETLVYEYISKNAILDNDGSTLKAEWAEDADTCLLDEQLIEMGVTWRILKRIGLAYGEERMSYEDSVRKAIGDDGGRKTLVMDGERAELRGIVVPDTGYGS